MPMCRSIERTGRRAEGWKLFGAALVLATACQAGHAAQLYESIGPDGVARYSDEPRDPTYRLIQSYGANEVAPVQAAPSPQPADRVGPKARLLPTIQRFAEQHGLPVALVEAIVAIESGFNPSAISPKGAIGAMQLMPATAAQYGLDTKALFDPEKNIEAGARHFKNLLRRHREIPIALAAYNAGSGAVERSGGRIPAFPETMAYVAAVMARAATASVPGAR